MEELNHIVMKYTEGYIEAHSESLDDLDELAAEFFDDVASIYDCVTRIKCVDRNPTGFSLSDAPILALLVRVWKLLKEIVKYHKENNADIISILERPVIEAAVTAHYLLLSDDGVIEDYRKCSYKDMLRILRESEEDPSRLETKVGKRVLQAAKDKMNLEGFTIDDFEIQKSNRWRLQNKSFYDIFSIAHDSKLYKYTYGMMSESIHGSWNDVLDYCLWENSDRTYSANPYSQQADMRFVGPLLLFCNPPYKLWLERIDADSDNLSGILDWIERVNRFLFLKFDAKYDG